MKYLVERLTRLHTKSAPPDKINKKVTVKGQVKEVTSHKDIGLGDVVQVQKGYLWRSPSDGKVWYYYIRAWFDTKNKKVKGPYWYKKRRLLKDEYISSKYGKTKGPGDVMDKYVGKRLPFRIPGALSMNPATLPRSVLNIISKSTKIADKLRELSQ